MKTIAIDVDGVLCDFVGGVLHALNNKCAKEWHREELACWNFFDLFDGRTKSLAYHYIAQPGFVESLDPYPGAVAGVDKLRSLGYHILIVTTPWDTSSTWVFERTRWLYDHFAVPPKDIIYTHRKELIPSNLFIDDKVENVTTYNSMRIHRRIKPPSVLWDNLHNQKDRPSNIKVMHNWDEVISYLESYEL